MGAHFAIKAYQYPHFTKVSSRITYFEKERGTGRRSVSVDIAYVTYSIYGDTYEGPIRDAWLFEDKGMGTMVPLLIDPPSPDKPIANGFFTFWLRVQVLIFMVLGGFILFAVLSFLN